VLAGVVAVVLTGWARLDPIITLLVATNITWTGVEFVRRLALGLLDTALPEAELAAIQQVPDRYAQPNVQFHALWTRQAGARRFVSICHGCRSRSEAAKCGSFWRLARPCSPR
jgi:divalent metal cation (Fe/Co/Zn/Cd) transporter